MSFTKVNELTIGEALALALVEFKDNRFTEKELAIRLSLLLSDRLRPGTFMVVRRIVDSAVEQGLLQVVPRPHGGEAYRISPKGAEVVSDFDLPIELFVKRNRLDGERNAAAKANAGPSMFELLAIIPSNKREFQRDRTFLESVFRQWRDQGWLSSSQVARVAEIGTRHGVFVPAHHYVGRAMDDWRQPYLQTEACRAREAFARAMDTKTAERALRRCREQIRAAALQANRQLKVELEQMERKGEFDQLDQLVTAVFPGTTLSRQAKVSAYAGVGSKALRVCIAALAFGKPPALVWKQSGQMSHPGAESEQWQTLLGHPAFKVIDRQGSKRLISGQAISPVD